LSPHILSIAFILCMVIGLHLYALDCSVIYLYCLCIFAYLLVASVYAHGQSNFSDTRHSWICASWYNYENNRQDALYRLIYYSK